MTDDDSGTGEDPLKLRATDEDDVAVLAACLQDALVPVHDMSFLSAESRFVLVANRFKWERLPAASLGSPSAGAYERVHCGISIEGVNRVQTRGFTPTMPADQGRLLAILTLQAERNPDGTGVITVLFAGDAALRLEVEGIEILVQDVGTPWPTMWRPDHGLGKDPDGEAN